MTPPDPTPAEALADLRALLAALLPIARERKQLLEKALDILTRLAAIAEVQ